MGCTVLILVLAKKRRESSTPCKNYGKNDVSLKFLKTHKVIEVSDTLAS